jgi:hypothetical protein
MAWPAGALLATVLMLAATPAVRAQTQADTAPEAPVGTPRWDLVLHTLTHHFHQPEHARWNNHNWGLALRRTLGQTTALQVGAYHNSNFEYAAYVIGEWLPLQQGPVAAGVFGGLVSGYRYPVAAGLVGRASWGAKSLSLRFAPKVYDTSSAFVSLELGWRL